MKLVLLCTVTFALSSGGLAKDAGDAIALPEPVVPSLSAPAVRPQPAPPTPSGLPRLFQNSKDLDLTVITEVTDYGQNQPPVLPEAPAYYAAQSGGYHTSGEHLVETPMTAGQVEVFLQRALSANGYLPATPAHPPTLVLIYSWGAHNAYDTDAVNGVGNPVASGDQVLRNILERATLVGGTKFAAELGKAVQQAGSVYDAIDSRLGSGSTMNLGAAQSMAIMSAAFDPVHLFKQRSARNEFLFNQTMGSCYYVVASAYDYQSLAHPPPRLLWRTRMTVNSQGVSQANSMPTLIISAGPFFGRPMAESEIMTRPALHTAQVEIGTPTVVGPAPAGTSGSGPGKP